METITLHKNGQYIEHTAQTQFIQTNFQIDIFQVLSNSNDLFEISKFFIDNATDPKFDIAKKIIKKFPNIPCAI